MCRESTTYGSRIGEKVSVACSTVNRQTVGITDGITGATAV